MRKLFVLVLVVFVGCPSASVAQLNEKKLRVEHLLKTHTKMEVEEALGLLAEIETATKNHPMEGLKLLWRNYVATQRGWCEYYRGDFPAARQIIKEALDGTKKGHGARIPLHRALGHMCLEEWDQAGAEEQLGQALSNADLHSPEALQNYLNEDGRLEVSLQYGQSLTALGKNKEAGELLRRVKKQIEDSLARPAPVGAKREFLNRLLLDCRVHLAELERRTANAVGGAAQLEQCLADIVKDDSPQGHQLQFRCRINLALTYWNLSRFAAAAAQLVSVENLLSTTDEAGLRDLNGTRAALAVEEVTYLYHLQVRPSPVAKLDAGEQAARRAISLAEKLRRGPTIRVANAYFQLAQLQELRGQFLELDAQTRRAAGAAYEKARQSYDEAMSHFAEVVWAKRHDLVPSARRCRARLYARLGQLDFARKEASTALADYKAIRPNKDTDVGYALFHEVLLDIAAGKKDVDAIKNHAQAHRQLTANQLVQYLPKLTAPEQISFFRMWDDPGLQGSLRLGTRHSELAEASATWLLNSKAKVAEIFAQANLAVGRGPDARNYREIVRRQAGLRYGRPNADATALQRQFLREEAEKRALTAKLNLPAKAVWHELDALQKKLKADEVFVDVVCLRAERSQERDYWAWVVTAKTAPKVVKLGDAGKIERLVKDFLDHQHRFILPNDNPMKEQALLLKLGAYEAERELHKNTLAPLSNSILEPLLGLNEVKTKTTWIVSPDGLLWAIPWGALVLPGDKYAVEEYAFRYAISGRDLINPLADSGKGAWVVADPDFQAKPPGNGWQNRVQNAQAAETLLAARKEGQEVAAAMNRSLNLDATVLERSTRKDDLLGRQATPRVLYLATHGFVAGENQFPVDDPLLSCGFTLAGYDWVLEGKEASGRSLPGLMTGAEVLELNLQGTELVVLSACQSGVGRLEYGHSPADLRHAFHLAGARQVVSSLWSVEDKATRELQVAFIEELRRTELTNAAAALRAAQLAMIQARRKTRDRDAHPYFWAGFTVSGK